MTTNQTIDGVPRAWLEEYESLADLTSGDAQRLRALLDAPESKPTGLSQGWNLTRKHDGFVIGHQSVAYPPDEKAIERAERDGYVWVPFLVPAAHAQGEPVAWQRKSKIKEGSWVSLPDSDVEEAIRLGYEVRKLYAEQPAPVAVAPERLDMTDGLHSYEYVTGHNAAIDKMQGIKS